MALIKGRNAQHMAGQAVVFDLGNLSRQAQALLEEAEVRAQNVLSHAQSEAQKLIDEASDKGFAEGKQEGEAVGRAEGYDKARQEVLSEFRPQLEQLLAGWTKALERWECERDAMILAAKEDVLRFALAVADRVVHRIPAVDPTAIQDQAAEALKYVSSSSALEIVIHPDDRPMLDSVLQDLLASVNGSGHATLVDDARIERGGCIVRSGHGEIDARLSTQMERIAEAIVSPEMDRRAPVEPAEE